MEFTDQPNTTAPSPSKHVEKPPPPPPTPTPNNLSIGGDHGGGGDGDDDDSCSSSASSSAASSPSHKSSSRKPPKPEATQPPPNQEMERSASGYRIPASVFERSKSSTAADWSVASNESLFSIHMGNMSFTNDHFMWRSGELAPPPSAAAAPSTSEQMFCYSAHSSTGGAADMRSRELGIAEATMLEVIKENEGRPQPSPALLAEARNARRSAGSNHSNMSFAFSVAGGDAERIPSSVKSSLRASQAQAVNDPQPQHDVQSPVAKEKGSHHQTRSKWLYYCCPCYAFCS